MAESQRRDIGITFERFAHRVATEAGSSWAFGVALLIIFVWLVTGPFFNYSDTWQLIINTGTTIVTFLMVFLIQQQQNKDALSIHLKLNEIVAALRGASNRLINVENLTESEVRELHERYQQLAKQVQLRGYGTKSCSIEEAVPKTEEAKSRASALLDQRPGKN